MNHAVFDTLLDAVVAIDGERRITYFNESCATLLEHPRRKIKLGTPCHELIRFQDDDLFCMPNGSWGRDDASPYREVDFESSSGRKGRVQISIQPALTGEWLLFMRDVTLEQALHQKYRSELKQKEQALEALEDYSKNLERKVEQRTAELFEANQLLAAILDSLGQGFLVFGRDTICQPVHSKACMSVLETSPGGKPIAEVLKTPPNEVTRLGTWIAALFAEQIPFEDLVELGPAHFAHSAGKLVTLEFYPVRDAKSAVSAIVLVATDRTRERDAEIQALRDREHAQRIIRIARNRSQFIGFAGNTLAMISEIQQRPADRLFALRALHTIKGGAGTFSVQDLHDRAHELEEKIANLNGPLPDSILEGCREIERSLRGFFDRNREIIGRDLNQLERRLEIPHQAILGFLVELRKTQASKQLERPFIDAFLRIPVQSLFGHVEPLMSDLAMAQGKELLPTRFVNGELKVGVGQYDEVFESLVHVFRNIIDHGIETPAERREAGKNPAGSISLAFSRESLDGKPLFMIRIVDDGRGIDPRAIRRKMEAKAQPISPSESDEATIQHIFDPGFSTRDEITTLSGRGIGLDAVATAVRSAGGEVSVSSRLARGTEILIQLPDQFLV